MSGESGGLSDIQLIDDRHPPQTRGQVLHGRAREAAAAEAVAGQGKDVFVERQGGPSRNETCPGQVSSR